MNAREENARPDAATFFDARAGRYDAEYDKPTGYALRSRMEVVLALVGDGPGEVLDAGMGGGRILAELARSGWTVSGIDASIEMVSVARKQLQGRAARVEQASIELLPFADESFDAVVATGVLEYADVQRAVRELRRVLRPGGLAVVSYPNPRNAYAIWRAHVWFPAVRAVKRLLRHAPLVFPPGSAELSPSRFRQLLESVGLMPEQTRPTTFLVVPSPFDKLLPRTAERLGRAVEGKRGRLGSRFAGQIVYAARKPAAPRHR